MNMIHSEASHVIEARPEEIWAVISDYRVGHAAILPRPPFTEMIVEEGGQGAGTLLLTRIKVWGKEFTFHQRVSEPEPGRLLLETDIDTGQFSTFRLEPLGGGQQTRVTIVAENPASPGLMGILERLTQPTINRRVFMQELRNLAGYIRTHAHMAN